MSVNLSTLYSRQYSTNIELLLQQKVSKLRGLVMSGNHKGDQASPVDQIGAIEMQPVVSRFAPIGRVDAPTDRRWVLPSDFDLNQIVDSFDKLKMFSEPESSYVQNAVAAANRKIDDLIIDAFFGTAKTGVAGATSTVFDTNYEVAVNFGASGNVGLTVNKLRDAKRILMANQVDLESDPITAVVTSKQHDDLLKEAQVISTDFNDKPVMVEGRVTRFLGVNIVHCERLDLNGSSYRQIPVFAKSGMYLGIWNDIQTDIDQRKDLSGHPWQAYLKMSMGATRLEEKKVVRILCAE